MSILFEVESLRIDEPRNILALLSTNTRRTKVVELSSGTHRCAVVVVLPAGPWHVLPHGNPGRRRDMLCMRRCQRPPVCHLWVSESLKCGMWREMGGCTLDTVNPICTGCRTSCGSIGCRTAWAASTAPTWTATASAECKALYPMCTGCRTSCGGTRCWTAWAASTAPTWTASASAE